MNEVVWELLRGGLATRALAIAADLRVARALADGPRPVEELAREAGADPDALHRILRALASDGVFEEVEPGIFGNTEASEELLRDGWDDFAHLFGGVWLRAAGELRADGEPTFPRLFGADWWSWVGARPDERGAFDRAMAGGKERSADRLDALEWRGDETVVDVGGGNGSLLRALLDRRPGLRGIVLDLPETARDEATFDERLQFVAGSFFERVPSGDVFVLAGILHDWDDERAGAILRTVRAAAGERARLVLLESVVAAGNEPDGAKWLDLLMLTLSAGRERAEAQWRDLLAATGWEPVSVVSGLIQARPA
jgi:hypothetical protein